jgi:FkbM family methyltransferase
MTLRDSLVVGVARSWIRFGPTNLFKEWLWRRAHWRDHAYQARTQHGVTMKGRSRDLVQSYIYYFGVWEPNLTAWLARRFREIGDAVFLDVGANVGYYTLLGNALMPGDIVSIEASPKIHAMLEDNVRLNRCERVRTVNCAATAVAGAITIFQGGDRNLGGSTTLVGIVMDDIVGIVVAGKPLSEILTDDELRRLRLVKIDVEGAEWSVLEGLRPVFDRLHHDVEFVIEITNGAEAKRIFDLFNSSAFNSYRLENSYAVETYLAPSPVRAPIRVPGQFAGTGDYIFSRRDQATL